ncbi:MAG: hypothetical protein Q8M44_01560, partial [bacterium]|nr:hypothetical protein [bacterium]
VLFLFLLFFCQAKISLLSSYLKNIPEKVHRKLLNIFDRLIVQNIKIKAQNENKSWKDKKIFIEN